MSIDTKAGREAPAKDLPPPRREHVLSVVRQSGGLSAVVCREPADLERERPHLIERPPRPADGAKMALLAETWTRLRRPRVADAELCAEALIVLLSSVPGRERPPGGVDPARSVRYREAVPWADRLEDPRLWSALRPLVEAHAPRVASRLGEQGFAPERLSLLRGAADPYLAFHHGLGHLPLRALPPSARALLPRLAGRPGTDVTRLLRVSHDLGLDRDPVLLAAVSLPWATRSAPALLSWLEVLAFVPSDQRLDRLREVCAAGVPEPPDDLGLAAVARRALATAPDRWEDRFRLLVDLVKVGWPRNDLRQFFELINRHASECVLASPGRCYWGRWRRRGGSEPAFAAGLDSLLHHLGVDPDDCPLPIRLFNHAGSLRRLGRHIARRRLLGDSPEVARALVRFHLACGQSLEELEPPEPFWLEIEAAFRAASPSHLGLLARTIEPVFWFGEESPRRATPLDHLAVTLSVARRLARPPFSPSSEFGRSLTALADAAAASSAVRRSGFLSAPERSFLRLQAARRLDHRAVRLDAGLDVLARLLPHLALDGFVRHPECLFRAARALGTLRTGRGLQVLRRLRQGPLFRPGLGRRPAAEIARLLLGTPGAEHLVPRRLRLHLTRGVPLSEGSLDRHRQSLAGRLVRARLGAVERAVSAALEASAGVTVRTPAERHAVFFLGALWRGHRMLKRLLRARETGDETFAFRHPKNLAWLARHPMLQTKPWFGAFRFEAVVRTMGPVRIAPETDPLEALRMGTLVGSCVSLGGGNEHSGLAVALDANKQVLFMRRPGGAFVARQVVGVSEDDQLVCYPVYPLGSPGPVKDAFLACDEALARAVGLPLRRVDEGASVVPLLVGHWYEDGLWDRLAEPLSRA